LHVVIFLQRCISISTPGKYYLSCSLKQQKKECQASDKQTHGTNKIITPHMYLRPPTSVIVN
jgi:hypothetical protein